MSKKRISCLRSGTAETLADFPALAASYLCGFYFYGGLIIWRAAPDRINRGFDERKAGRAIRRVIMFGDAA